MISRVIDNVRRFFIPPRFDDEEQARTASLLMTIFQIMLAILGLYAVLSLLNHDVISLMAVGAGTTSVVCVVVLLHRGRVQLAGLVFTLLAWTILTGATLLFGGLKSGAFSALLLLTLVLGALLTDRARLLITTLTLASSLAVYVVETTGNLPTTAYEPSLFFDAIVRASVFLAAALILFLISRSLHDALHRARITEQAVREVLGDLVDATTSKAYLDNILRSITDILIVMDADMRIRRVNQAAVDLLGYTEAELVGQTPDAIFSASACDLLARARQEPIRSIATTLVSRSGDEIPISLSASRLDASSGQMQGLVCVAQDMSERERAAQELRKRDELYRTLARNLPDMGVLLFDHDLRFMLAEGAVFEREGVTTTKVEGQTTAEALPVELTSDIEATYHGALAGQHTMLDVRINDHTYNVQALPVKNETGSIFAGLMLIHDITTIRQAEDELRRHIEQLTILRRVDTELNHKLDVRYVLDLALDMALRVSVSRAGAVLLLDGNQELSVELAIGDFAEGLLDGYPRPPDDRIEQVLNSGQAASMPDTGAIIPLISRNRPIGVLLLESFAPFSNERLQFMQVLTARIAVAVDNARLYQVSQRQLAELQALYERVSQLEQLKTDMIRMAAHDLRNPINVVSGFSELLLESGTLPEHEHNQAAHIFKAAQRMQKLVADILSLERITQLHAGGLHQTVDLAALTRQLCETHHSAAPEHDLRCNLPEIPIYVCGDSPQLSEAMTNLVTNAIKYTPAGGHIDIILRAENQHAIFEVADTGYGIPDDMQQRLFQPFYRARSGETSSIEGTGLGLHLVKNVVERHNGNLRFHSIYQQGSTFGFELPLAAEMLEETTSGEVHEPAGETEPRSY